MPSASEANIAEQLTLQRGGVHDHNTKSVHHQGVRNESGNSDIEMSSGVVGVSAVFADPITSEPTSIPKAKCSSQQPPHGASSSSNISDASTAIMGMFTFLKSSILWQKCKSVYLI